MPLLWMMERHPMSYERLSALIHSFFFIRTFFYKNFEAEIDPDFKTY